jgi:hypothetical protein
MIESGANGSPRANVFSIQVAVTADNRVNFVARDPKGIGVHLAVRQWQCENGSLVTHAPLGTSNEKYDFAIKDESFIRVWKASDGSLIAEHTLQSVMADKNKLVQRFYFRFDAVETASGS